MGRVPAPNTDPPTPRGASRGLRVWTTELSDLCNGTPSPAKPLKEARGMKPFCLGMLIPLPFLLLSGWLA